MNTARHLRLPKIATLSIAALQGLAHTLMTADTIAALRELHAAWLRHTAHAEQSADELRDVLTAHLQQLCFIAGVNVARVLPEHA